MPAVAGYIRHGDERRAREAVGNDAELPRPSAVDTLVLDMLTRSHGAGFPYFAMRCDALGLRPAVRVELWTRLSEADEMLSEYRQALASRGM